MTSFIVDVKKEMESLSIRDRVKFLRSLDDLEVPITQDVYDLVPELFWSKERRNQVGLIDFEEVGFQLYLDILSFLEREGLDTEVEYSRKNNKTDRNYFGHQLLNMSNPIRVEDVTIVSLGYTFGNIDLDLILDGVEGVLMCALTLHKSKLLYDERYGKALCRFVELIKEKGISELEIHKLEIHKK